MAKVYTLAKATNTTGTAQVRKLTLPLAFAVALRDTRNARAQTATTKPKPTSTDPRFSLIANNSVVPSGAGKVQTLELVADVIETDDIANTTKRSTGISAKLIVSFGATDASNLAALIDQMVESLYGLYKTDTSGAAWTYAGQSFADGSLVLIDRQV